MCISGQESIMLDLLYFGISVSVTQDQTQMPSDQGYIV